MGKLDLKEKRLHSQMIGKVWQSLKYPHVIGKISNYHMASNCLKIKKVSVFHRYHDYMFPYFNNGSHFREVKAEG